MMNNPSAFTLTDIQKQPSKTYPTLSNYLYMIYEWRSEYSDLFDLDRTEDLIDFVIWWLRWGHINFNVDPLLAFSDDNIASLCKESDSIVMLEDQSFALPTIFKWVHEGSDFKELPYSPLTEPEHFVVWCFLDGVIALSLPQVWANGNCLSNYLKKPHKSYPQISNFLYLYYKVDEGIQNNFNIETTAGQLDLLNWWLKYCKESKTLSSFDTLDPKLLEILHQGKHIKTPPPMGPNTTYEPTAKAPKNYATPKPFGINIIGMYSSQIGIGEDCRLIYQSLIQAGIPTSIIDIETDNLSDIKPAYNINLFTLPAPNIAANGPKFNSDFFDGAINIASTPWELPHWPKSLYWMFDYFDHIWVHSDFVYNAIPEQYQSNVSKIPLPVVVAETTQSDRDTFKLHKDDFIFFTSFDYSSYSARKNPRASINAFFLAKKELNLPENCKLLIKSVNGHLHQARLDELIELAAQNSDIILIDKSLSKQELHNLYQSCDCFISLHRSEGFGRNIAEAMLLEVPVITTNFSGNLDFCSETTAYLVDADMIPLNNNDYIFSANQYWAEPKIKHAAQLMVEASLKKGHQAQKQLIANAKKFISEYHSIKSLTHSLNITKHGITPSNNQTETIEIQK